MSVEYVFRNDDGSTEVETVEVADIVEETAVEWVGVDGAATTPRRPSLSALLVEAGLASDEQIHEALEEGDRTGEKLGEVIVRRGWASEGQLAQLLAQQWGLQAVDPGALSLDPLAVNRLEISVAAQLGGFPVWFDTQGIVVAVAEPTEERFAAFREQLGSVSFVVVSRSTLHELVESRLFGAKGKDAKPDQAELHVTSNAPAFVDDAPASGDDVVHLAVHLTDEPSRDSVSSEHAGKLDGPAVVVDDAPPAELEVVSPPALSPLTPAASPVTPAMPPVQRGIVERLRAIEVEVQGLEDALADARQTLEARSDELEAIRGARQQDLDTIRHLEAEVADRERRFEALRAKVADLSLAFDD